MHVPHLFAKCVDRGLDLPRPVRSGLTLAGVGVLPLLAAAAGAIRPLSGLVFAAIFAAAGVLQALLARHELTGLRRQADGELRRNRRPYFQPALVSCRSSELVSERHRGSLARAVTRTERDLSPAMLPNASPLNRIAARPYVQLFHELAERVAALDHPIEPRGVVLVENLLTAPDSPLYARERACALHASLLACIDTLDAEPDAVPAGRERQIPAGGRRELQLAATANDAATAKLGGMADSRDRSGSH